MDHTTELADAADAFGTWLAPIDPGAPCGASLEYDGDFMVLQASLQPAVEVQYGSFTGRRDGPDWAEIERQCRALLLRSLDITLLVWLARCRARRAGAQGVCEGMALLARAIDRFPGHIHPQAEAGEGAGPSLRANALAALVDPDGWLADVRAVVIVARAAGHLTVRDVERSRLRPRPPDAPDPGAVRSRLETLRAQQQAQWVALSQAAGHVQVILGWCTTHLPGDAPDLRALTDLLEPFAEPAVGRGDPLDDTSSTTAGPDASNGDVGGEVSPEAHTVATPDIPAGTTPQPAGLPDVCLPEGREAARRAILGARDWFEHHEPSSPVGLLLRRAERLVGRPYAEVAGAIPAELLARWSAEER